MNSGPVSQPELITRSTTAARMFGWCILALTFGFVLNDFLIYGAGLPGAALVGSADPANFLSLLQLAVYPAVLAVAIVYVAKNSNRTLREESDRISNINTVFIRCAFWVVLIVGVADMAISFLRVEGFLDAIVGEELSRELIRSHFRGKFVHMPLMAIGIVIGLYTRSLGFTWLTLMIVMAELLIVITRFVFSYEQAFMADLVRFWYGALFLFASAYTLLKEGHVRVDVFYTNFSYKKKGLINALGSVFMGIVLCWTILFVGMGGKASIINSPIFNFEVTQSGFGLYVKYMMAGFLGVFAISMMIQFVASFLDSVADYRGDPGRRVIEAPGMS